jgi:hypothetical protein
VIEHDRDHGIGGAASPFHSAAALHKAVHEEKLLSSRDDLLDAA